VSLGTILRNVGSLVLDLGGGDAHFGDFIGLRARIVSYMEKLRVFNS
jgi:hypothetical protein